LRPVFSHFFLILKTKRDTVDKVYEVTDLSMLVLTRKLGESIAIDLSAAVLIFLLIGGSITWVWSNKATGSEGKLLENETRLMADRTLETLISSKGQPEDWKETSSIDVIGLAKRDRILDEDKVNQFVWRAGLLDRGLVSTWHLNGDALDLYGANHGSFEQGANANAEGLWGTKAGLFNGTSSYIDAGNNSSLDLGDGNFTLSAWVWFNNNTTPAYQFIVGRGRSNPTYSYELYHDGGSGVYGIHLYAGGQEIDSGELLEAEKWQKQPWKVHKELHERYEPMDPPVERFSSPPINLNRFAKAEMTALELFENKIAKALEIFEHSLCEDYSSPEVMEPLIHACVVLDGVRE